MSIDFKGISLRVGATFFFTLMVLFIKWLSDEIPVGQVVFFRSAFALIPLVLFLMWTREFPSGLKTKRPRSHFARCILGCLAMFASFASLKYLPLSHASIIGLHGSNPCRCAGRVPVEGKCQCRALVRCFVRFSRDAGADPANGLKRRC